MLGVEDDEKLAITATRIVPHKQLEHILYTCEELDGVKWKYAICGMNDGDYSNWLRERVKEYGLEDRVIFMPFLNNVELNEMYNASDVGVWYHPTIAALSAMGTGLPVVLQNRKKIAHLKDEELVTVFDDDLKSALGFRMTSDIGIEERKRLAEQVEGDYSYEAILSKVFEKVNA